MDLSEIKKINIITGHYGCGKTNFAVNLALRLSDEAKKVSVVDLDIVNPYFRSADFKELFNRNNIQLAASVYANTNLDIPAITFDIERLAREDGYLIIDVGGDEAGAVALGRYREIFKTLGDDKIQMLYVINSYRYLLKDPKDCVSLMREIETVSRLKCTALVNNSNLGTETTLKTVSDSLDYADKVSKLTGLSIKFTCVPEGKTLGINGEFPVKRYVKALWE